MDFFSIAFIFFIIFEGDNRQANSLTWYESMEERSIENPFILAHVRWPNGVIPYSIDPSAAKYASLILRAFDSFEQNTCIRFVPRNVETNYINIFHGEGCYSNVGMIGGEQHLSIGNGCEYMGNVLALLAHAVGLLHEHNRPDRDNFITIRWPEILENAQSQFKKLQGDTTKMLTPLDLLSVTLFGEKSFSKSGHTIMRSLYNVHFPEVYQKTRLSDGDISGINFLYKCK